MLVARVGVSPMNRKKHKDTKKGVDAITSNMMCDIAEKHSKLGMQLTALAFADVVDENTTPIIIQPEDIDMLRDMLLKYIKKHYPDKMKRISNKISIQEIKGDIRKTLTPDIALLILLKCLIKDIQKRLRMEILLHILMEMNSVTHMHVSYEREKNAIVVRSSIDIPTPVKSDNTMYR